MGRASRPKPARLAEKLRHVRTSLGLSQNGMIVRMELDEVLVREEVSLFEHGLREPPLPVLLQYARAANVYVEVLIDDEVDLPEELPSRRKSEGARRKGKSRSITFGRR
jgi:transcriptional regulator with XRE-family HTH domain